MNTLQAMTFMLGKVLPAVKQAEKLFPKKGSGAKKKKFVVEKVAAALDFAISTGSLRGDFKDLTSEDTMVLAGGAVELAVSLFNLAGKFK